MEIQQDNPYNTTLLYTNVSKYCYERQHFTILIGNINCLGEADNYSYVDNAFILLSKNWKEKK